MSGLLPAANPTDSFWLSSPHPLACYRSSDSTPEECDIAIIGTGLAGVATAYHILMSSKAEERPRIVLFEARQACSGATGRNGGHIKTLLPMIKSIFDRHGSEVADQLGAWVLSQRSAIKATAEKENIECDLLVTRSFDAYFDPEQAREIKTWLQEQRRANAAWTQDVQWLEGPNLERVTNVKGIVAAASVPATSLWPYKFVTSLLARVVDMGALLYTETPVTTVDETATTTVYGGEEEEEAKQVGMDAMDGVDGGMVSLVTPRGTTRARIVVHATNGYTSAVLPQYRGVVVPSRGQNSILVPLGRGHHGLNLAHTCNLIYGAGGAADYLVPRPDGTVILGGATGVYRRSDQDRNARWFNTVDDATLIDEAVRVHFDGTMARRFRGWENSEASAAMTWTGIMGVTPDQMPHVGLIPGTTNQYILAGFNGAGMTMIFTTAKEIAGMVLSGKPFEQTNIPGVFKTTEERLSRGFGGSD